MKNAKTHWALMEDNPDMDFGFARIWCNGSVRNFKKYTKGKSYKEMLTVFRPYHGWFYYGDEDSKEIGDHLATMITTSPSFGARVNKQIVVMSDRLRAFSSTLPRTDLGRYSNQRLWQWFHRHQVLHTAYYAWAWIPVAVDMMHNNLTEKIKRYLRSIDVPENKLNEYFMILTAPVHRSLIQDEQTSLLRIIATIQKNKRLTSQLKKKFDPSLLPSDITRAIQRHHDTYLYMPHMWVGKAADYNYYYAQIQELLKSDIHALQDIKKDQQTLRMSKRNRVALMKKLDITSAWREVFYNFGEFMVTKIYRRYAQIYAVYMLEPILMEMAKRINVSLYELRCMLPQEIEQALLHEKINRKAIKDRAELFIYYVSKTEEEIYTGAKARALVKEVEIVVDNVHELTGQVGCVGTARGTVKIVITPGDMAKMKKGDILVSIATNPDIVPAMKKASAIVTEQGGVTSHAAIVARELQIPCVIGTKIATRVLKDGDRVEVDAYKGVVRRI